MALAEGLLIKLIGKNLKESDRYPKVELAKSRHFCMPRVTDCGSGSSVLIATDYALDGPGSNPGRGEIFRKRPDRPWGPSSLLYNGYPVFTGVNRPGRGADHPPLLAPSLRISRAIPLLRLKALGGLL
jgi:hypothetical protein